MNRLNLPTSSTSEKFSQWLDSRIDQMTEMAIERLDKIGQEAIELAVSEGTYIDLSGDLRSSLGYGVVLDGTIVRMGGFTPTKGRYGNGSNGVLQGKALLYNVASQSDGLCLVLVVGMKYAMEVESIHGHPVIAPAKLRAQTLIAQLR